MTFDPTSTSVLVFDVNETLLDIESLGPHFDRIFGDAHVLRTWFGELVTYSMTLTLSGYYVDFFALGRAVLHMIGEIRDVVPTDDDVQALADAMRTMPAHPDVAPGFRAPRGRGVPPGHPDQLPAPAQCRLAAGIIPD